MYEFSVPMPYSKEAIDKLIEINNEVEKSKITSLYFSLPSTNELFTGFEQRRNQLLDKISFDFWKNLANYSMEKGFNLIYCFNLPRPLSIENPIFSSQIENLHRLLTEFEKIGLNKLRVASSKLISYLYKYFPKFNLLLSTASEYKIIQEFQFLKQIHPYIKEIIPSHDVNKNFKLLKNIKKLGFEIEIMLNDGCIKGCSNRMEHLCAYTDSNIRFYTQEPLFQEYYSKWNCSKVERENPILYMVKGNHIYPWEIEEYAKIGIKKFKLTGRDALRNDRESMTNKINFYLKGVDDIKNISNIPLIRFACNSTNQEILKNLTVKECRKYLPNIKYFTRHGHLCISICGEECRYCYKCAENVQKIFNIYEEKERLQNIPVCVYN